MTDPATPDALRAIASMMRMDEYTPDVLGVEALVLDNAADEIERLRELIRYIWAHGDEHGKVPYSWGQEYAERFIKLAKQEWERKND